MSLIRTKFDGTSTAEEVVAGHDLSGIRAIVTGGASGIGIETARALAIGGAEVTLAVRNVATGKKVAAEIRRFMLRRSTSPTAPRSISSRPPGRDRFTF